jgi:hypothetical protein
MINASDEELRDAFTALRAAEAQSAPAIDRLLDRGAVEAIDREILSSSESAARFASIFCPSARPGA